MTDRIVYKDAPGYCHLYFDLVETNDLLAELEKSRQLTEEVIRLITPGKENFSYLPGKWTTKEVLRHIIDCEQVIALFKI